MMVGLKERVENDDVKKVEVMVEFRVWMEWNGTGVCGENNECSE